MSIDYKIELLYNKLSLKKINETYFNQLRWTQEYMTTLNTFGTASIFSKPNNSKTRRLTIEKLSKAFCFGSFMIHIKNTVND